MLNIKLAVFMLYSWQVYFHFLLHFSLISDISARQSLKRKKQGKKEENVDSKHQVNVLVNMKAKFYVIELNLVYVVCFNLISVYTNFTFKGWAKSGGRERAFSNAEKYTFVAKCTPFTLGELDFVLKFCHKHSFSHTITDVVSLAPGSCAPG